MKRAFVFLALTLALVSTGCNSCRPRLFGNWFNNGDCCDSGCGMSGTGGMVSATPMSSRCEACSQNVPTGVSGEWVPVSGGSASYGYVPEEIPSPLVNPSRIGPQG